ncbi:MAG TPA: hypothetical protein VFG02_04765, partial [Nitrospirota bacterium]|nr:hypothetical protein [Nitrospirota bacterium]
MNRKHETTGKLLPKLRLPDPFSEDYPVGITNTDKFRNIGLALITTLLLAFVLLPRIPLLVRGDVATRDIAAPYTLYIEYVGPDDTLLSYKVMKGEVIVEAGHRVTERAARILEELGRREGIGNRWHAYLGLCLLILILFFLFYRDIRRYRPSLIMDTRKMFLLSFL